MHEYPKALYRKGDSLHWEGRDLDLLVVDDAQGEAAAMKQGWLRAADLLSEKPVKAPDPLDHDGDGRKGGSEKGAASTAAKGARKRK